MTDIAASAESRVRAAWKRVFFYPRVLRRQLTGSWALVECGGKEFYRETPEAAWQAALEYTEARQEQARQIEEEITVLRVVIAQPGFFRQEPVLQRILAARQEALATATRGMKERK